MQYIDPRIDTIDSKIVNLRTEHNELVRKLKDNPPTEANQDSERLMEINREISELEKERKAILENSPTSPKTIINENRHKKYEQGLIEQYLKKIDGLATRAEMGESVEVVEAGVQETIKKALEHFAIVKTSDPAANRARFKVELGLRVDICHPSQPKRKKAIEYALSLLTEWFRPNNQETPRPLE